MNYKYDDLENIILSCFLKKPNLLNKTKLEDKHFKKHKKIFVFYKAVYKKFGTLDLAIQYSISKNKYRIVEYNLWIMEYAGFPSLFEKYEQRLIEIYEEEKKEKYIKEKIYEATNNLIVGNIETKDFKEKINKIYETAEKIEFKE